MKVLLRNTDTHALKNGSNDEKIELGLISLPSKIWKELGWKIGEELEIKVERGLTKDREYFRECIVIERGVVRNENR